MAEAQIAALTAQVEKEKNTAKENLQKAIKASREKKVVETELQQVKQHRHQILLYLIEQVSMLQY
jgi:hypothetical protein